MRSFMSPGKRIRRFRLKRGMTQRALGTAVGFPAKTADIRIAQYESGARTPKHGLLCALAQALDIPVTLYLPEHLDFQQRHLQLTPRCDA